MFEFIRTHQRLMQFLLLLFIFPSFAFFGLEGYSRLTDDNGVAKVAGQTITKEEWDAAHRQQLDRMRQVYGNQFDAKLFDTAETRRAILDNLIAQRALGAEVVANKLVVPDQVLQQSILQIPGLTKPDGTFDNEQYRVLLAAQGLTPKSYEAGLRREMALQQLNAAIQTTAFAPKTVAENLSNLNDQERTVQMLNFKPDTYASQVKVSDEMLQAYYDKNGRRFETPESANIEYVVLDAAAVAAQSAVTDDDIKSYYEQNKKQYSTDEQRRASHILITVKKDAPAADKAAAKAKADGLVAQLRKNPGDFAKLAKANSQDPGSAENGGDLGFFGRGAMVKPFEDAAFSLKQGEISDPIESDFGYHVIEVTGIKPAAVKPLDSVKDEIAGEIKKQIAAKKYSELADQFNNLVYENGDSLKAVSDKLKLKIQSATGVMRNPNPAAGAAPYNNAKFLTALFTDDVIKSKHNTEAVQAAPNTLIAGRITEYHPVAKRPFADVKADVQKAVTLQEEQALALKAGQARLAELQGKDDGAGFSEAKVVSRVKAEGWTEEAFNAVMKADTAKLPVYVGAETPGLGYQIYRVTKVEQPKTVDAARRKTEQEQIAGALSQQEALAYLGYLREKAKTKLLKGAASVSADDAAK
ncbi:SurA N-terminal domain-containing protein [Herbaspirillum sp. LeCh32-8]|uniref:SurA N-terminal domain-containing protein n=1 Tax=Herbaspirillum sp. LeCh32-8 TaxID=2821356 RepID=UPI001AEAC42A|nr:SurA N-terminal domain-containing protein [Herbaspirillum sp. LeCh32-8]MBP0597188.1 SurA N-terminal domain-containing protein [Herbaspirillum sp. LeCh32-8]